MMLHIKYQGSSTFGFRQEYILMFFYKPTLTQSKKEGKYQESIQSSTTPDPGYQWESDNATNTYHKREPRGQLFSST